MRWGQSAREAQSLKRRHDVSAAETLADIDRQTIRA
jgi:hypothetical protein